MNKILLATLAMLCAAWAAAQRVGVIVFDDRPRYSVICLVVSGGVVVMWAREDFGGHQFNVAVTSGQRRPLCLPRVWHGLGKHGVRSEVVMPFWMMVFPPAVLLAWRLRQAQKNTRGFEVAAA